MYFRISAATSVIGADVSSVDFQLALAAMIGEVVIQCVAHARQHPAVLFRSAAERLQTPRLLLKKRLQTL